MVWTQGVKGVFEVSLEENSKQITVKMEKPLAHYQALQLADALIRAGHELTYHRPMKLARNARKNSTV